MTQEALKLALEFIERVNKDGWILADFEPQMYATIIAIKEALAQPEQKPVIDKSAAIRIATSLGWSPQRTWVGLTDEEIEELMDTYDVASTDYAHAIEAKLKEKNA